MERVKRPTRFLLFSLFFLFQSLFYFYSCGLGEQKKTIEWKPWLEYTSAEKDSLRNRWRKDPAKVKEIIKFLKEGKSLPFYVNRLTIKEKFKWRTERDREIAQDKSYDLRGIAIDSIDLKNVNLEYAHLEGDSLSGANLDGAILNAAHLEGAILLGSRLGGVVLRRAKMREAELWEADLRFANLTGADLAGVNLQKTLLDSANLYHAIFGNTLISDSQFVKAVNTRFIVAGEGRFRKDWDLEVVEYLHKDAKNIFKREGMKEMEKESHFWENEAITERSGPIEKWLRIIFLKWTYGYSSKPMRLFWRSLEIVIAFTIIFLFITLPRKWKTGIYVIKKHCGGEEENRLSFRKGWLALECFYFSLLSFTTFGYGPLQPGRWIEFFDPKQRKYKAISIARIFVGVEAGLGVWLFALLVIVLFGK